MPQTASRQSFVRNLYGTPLIYLPNPGYAQFFRIGVNLYETDIRGTYRHSLYYLGI